VNRLSRVELVPQLIRRVFEAAHLVIHGAFASSLIVSTLTKSVSQTWSEPIAARVDPENQLPEFGFGQSWWWIGTNAGKRLLVPLPGDPKSARQRIQIVSNQGPIGLHSWVQWIRRHKTVNAWSMLEDIFHIGCRSLASIKLVSQVNSSSFKFRPESVDVCLRLGLIDASLDQCPIQTIAKPAGAAVKSLKDDADLPVIGTWKRSSRLCADVDDSER
jgi:hypothetical protein